MTPRWMAKALCQHFPTLPWIAEPQDRSARADAAMAVVCVACPVLAKCQQYADRPDVTSGFWAGADRTPTSAESDETGAA